MDYKFMKLDSDSSDSSDYCEVLEVVSPKEPSSKSNMFGSHLSTQQCNNRNMRERNSSTTKKNTRPNSEVLKHKEVDLQEIEDKNIPDNMHQIHPERRESWTRHSLGEGSCNVQINGMISSEEEDIIVFETPKTKRIICKGKAGSSKDITVRETLKKKRVIRKCKCKAGSSRAKASNVTKKKVKKTVELNMSNSEPRIKMKRKNLCQECPSNAKKLKVKNITKRKTSMPSSCKKTVGGVQKRKQVNKEEPEDTDNSITDITPTTSVVDEKNVTAIAPSASTTAANETSSIAINVQAPICKNVFKREPQNDDLDAFNPSCSQHCSSTSKSTISTVNSATQEAKVPHSAQEELTVSLFQENLRFWKDEEVVAETTDAPLFVAKNMINLLNQQCTIPFIARYRKEMVGNSTPDKLREIQDAYENIKIVRRKVDTVLKNLEKQNNVCETTAVALLNAKTLTEVEHLAAPFKSGSSKTYAERARKLGLGDCAKEVMNGTISLSQLNLQKFVKPGVKGISTVCEVLDGIQHVIADIIAKDREVLDHIAQMSKVKEISITSKKSSTAEKEDKKAYVEGREINYKFELYHKFDMYLDRIKSHQVMALNRGEALKKLTVRVQLPTFIKHKTHEMCWNKFFSGKNFDPETLKFMKKCIDDGFARLLEPYLQRTVRSELTKKAQKESVSVFCSNLKNLLLTPPVRGKTVMGIDPGFLHGCKLAVVSFIGEVLATGVIYPHTRKGVSDQMKIKELVITNMVSIIAIGNGNGCRETEMWLSQLIKCDMFSPLEVKYCIVSEQGISIYSVSKEAENELPNLDSTSRGAVGIARRLQDPLLEYLKLEPKNFGVGMYQHDLPEAMLKVASEEVVIECVSFVGVDLNVCPEFLLRKVSGLSAAKAKSIIEWRKKNGSFVNREQLLSVKGLGPKAFEQCAGFVKILPETRRIFVNVFEEVIQKKRKNAEELKENPLDRTVIHPESYEIAMGFLSKLDSSMDKIGTAILIREIDHYMKYSDVIREAASFGVPEQRMQQIIDALKQPLEYDIRSEFERPLFRTAATNLEDLRLNISLTGCVRNVTQFGAFVDIGVGHHGLVHISKMKNVKLNFGDRVTVKVISLDLQKKRIGLGLIERNDL